MNLNVDCTLITTTSTTFNPHHPIAIKEIMESIESQYFEMPNFSHGLRIGNYYEWFHEESSSYYKADADFIKTQFEYDTNPDDDQFSRGWWASPVLLTPEILLKAGFDVTDTDALLLPLYLSKDFGYYRVHLTDKENGLNLNIELVYLHQLQNLYHALTSTELKIEL